MGRGIHCSLQEKELIRKLRSEGKTFQFISEIVGCSKNMVTNALKCSKKPETRGRKRKTSQYEDKQIKKLVKIDPFKTSTAVKTELQLNVTSRTIRNRLLEQNLRARAARKVPFINKKNCLKRKHFAEDLLRKHEVRGLSIFKNILWSDETKINLFGADSRHYVRRPACKEYDPQYTKKTIKHGGGNIMLWGSFSWYGVGPLFWIKEKMTADIYLNILEDVMAPYAEDNMPLVWKFQQDNDPKHTAKKTKTWFALNKVDVLPWPAQSPDINPIENLWHELKKQLEGKKCKNKEELWRSVQQAWYSIPIETCRNLVTSMPRRLEAVIKNSGYSTKY